MLSNSKILLMIKRFYPFIAVSIIIFIVAIIVLVVNNFSWGNAIRITLGLWYIFFLPGYIWYRIFWPAKHRDAIVEIIMSLILSIVIVPLIIILFSRLGMSITISTILTSVTIINIVGIIFTLKPLKYLNQKRQN